jgi:hypothetical protein
MSILLLLATASSPLTTHRRSSCLEPPPAASGLVALRHDAANMVSVHSVQKQQLQDSCVYWWALALCRVLQASNGLPHLASVFRGAQAHACCVLGA